MEITFTDKIIQNLPRDAYQLKRYSKGSILFHEDDRCLGVFLLLKGQIRILSYRYSEKETVFNVLKAGDFFGNNLLFSSAPFYRGDVRAEEDCLLAFFEKEKLLNLLSSDRSFLLYFLEKQADFTKDLNCRLQLLSLSEAQDRLFYFLHAQGGIYTFKSVSSLANDVNLRRETLSRLLHQLEKAGILLIQNKTISLKGGHHV